MYDLDLIKQLASQLADHALWKPNAVTTDFDDYFRLAQEYALATQPALMLAMVQDLERVQEKCKQAELILSQ